jgi:AcrR family transcriptional regulator
VPPISQGLTRKGNLRVREILDAAVCCLARDGYAATSIQRVADEAGLHKRAVLYYCGSREGLFDAVVRDLGDRLFDPLERVLTDLDDPKDIVERGYDMIWAAITTDRALLVAWFGLRAEAITNPVLAATANYISDRFRALISRLIDRMLSLGRMLRVERTSLEVMILACSQGLILDYLERGETPGLHEAVAEFQDWLASVSLAPR